MVWEVFHLGESVLAIRQKSLIVLSLCEYFPAETRITFLATRLLVPPRRPRVRAVYTTTREDHLD